MDKNKINDSESDIVSLFKNLIQENTNIKSLTEILLEKMERKVND